MPNPRLAGRYSKSLIDLAIEKGRLETVHEDMQWLHAVTRSNRDFVNMLRSPIISSDKKEKIVEAVTKGNISDLTAAFNRLLISKGRESFLPEIISSFISQYKTYKNIHIVKLTTAAPISEATRNEIIAQVKKTSGLENIELESSVDDKLIGGFVLQTGDKMIDASIAYDLRAVARQFENNDFIYKLR